MGKVVSAVGKVFEVVGAIAGLLGAPWGAPLLVMGAVAEGIGSYFSKPKIDLGKDINSGGQLVNTRRTTEVLPVVYGECRVGGNWIWVKTDGEDNKYLRIVMTLSEGPIDSVTNLYLNGQELSSTPQAGLVNWAATNGDETQTIPSIVSDYGFTDNCPWVSLLCIVLTYNREKWQGIPNITATVRGRLLYDPRTGTTTWSDNPALVALDFLRNPRYGLGVQDERIDFDSFASAADYCDDKNYRFNGIVLNERRWDAFQEILSHFNASLFRSYGKYKLKIKDLYNETVVMNITNDDIVEGSFRLMQPSLIDRVNTIKVQILDPDINYQVNTITVEDVDAISTEPVKSTEIRLLGASREHAIKIANYLLKRNKLNGSVSVTVGPRAMVLEQGDVISLTYDDFGISDKLYRVTGISYNNNDTVTLTLLEEDYSLYDETANVVIASYPQTTLPDPYETPSKVDNLSVGEVGYQQADGSWATRLKVTFDEPNYPFVDYYELWVSEDSGPYIHVANIGASAPGSTVTYYYENTREYSTYNIKVITVNIHKVKSQPAYTSIRTTGKDEAPSDVSNFRGHQSGEYVILQWDHVPDKDVIGYQIREGATWNSGRVIIDRISKNLAYWRPPLDGTYRFWIKAIDVFGTLSRNAVDCQVTVGKLSSLINIIYDQDEFALSPPVPGDKDNFIYVPEQNALMIPCALTDQDVPGWTDTTAEIMNYDGSINLTASYTTNVIDLGATTLGTVRLLPFSIEAVHQSVTDQTYPDRTDLTYPNDTDIHITAEVGVKKFILHSLDGVSYTEEEFTGVVDQQLRYLKSKITVILDTHKINFKLKSFETIVDVPEKDKYVLNQSIDIGGTSFALSDLGIKFYKEYIVGITCYGQYYAVISNKDLTGFTVTLYDSAGNNVTGVVDLHLRGY